MMVPVVQATKQEILGVPIDALTMEEVLDRVDDTIVGRGRLQIGVVNAAKLVNMRRDPALRADVLSCNLILADGVPVVWASRLLGRPLPERVAGIDLMLGMLRRGNEHGYRIYCLGASEDVLATAVARIAGDYPHVEVVGHHHGYFTSQEEPGLVAAISDAKLDILLVGMSSPKKERFLARWSDQLGVSVCHGVGGSLDVLSGKVRRAPLIWQRLGLEWLYRVCQEPRRLWRRYLVTNTLFCAMVLSELVRRRLLSPPVSLFPRGHK
ncbi:MAG: WecB/TagA/CpsF family glycosyltransferase [Candidatus Rokubacteria bacterium]|nr:WecB/TagA/CpsF family glycosyltransferase [Candidatus Rokubacteria bacterium]